MTLRIFIIACLFLLPIFGADRVKSIDCKPSKAESGLMQQSCRVTFEAPLAYDYNLIVTRSDGVVKTWGVSRGAKDTVVTEVPGVTIKIRMSKSKITRGKP